MTLGKRSGKAVTVRGASATQGRGSPATFPGSSYSLSSPLPRGFSHAGLLSTFFRLVLCIAPCTGVVSRLQE